MIKLDLLMDDSNPMKDRARKALTDLALRTVFAGALLYGMFEMLRS